MGTYTTNLNMYKTNMLTDGNDTFDFKRDINDNLDIIDTAVGKLSTLTTTDKSSLVNAIIELVTSLGGKASKDLDNLSATGQAILDGKVEVEALLAQNGYAKFSWKENNVISNLIIQWGVGTSGTTYSLPITLMTVFASLAIINNYSSDISAHTITTNNITLHAFNNMNNSAVNTTVMAFFVIGN